MTTSLDHLLPDPDVVVRCAEHARQLAVDPGGTAIRADRVVLVVVPGPWPKPALDHPRLAPIAEALSRSLRPTRLLASLPPGSDPDGDAATADGAGDGGGSGAGVTMTVFERRGPSAIERRYRTSNAGDTVSLAVALANDDAEGATPYLEAEHGPARPALLICTQGSHDVCCGAEGTRLAGEIQARIDATLGANAGVDPVIVHRVSHTGGHRFAPTAMTMPDGRMWAGLNSSLVDRILAGAGAADQAARPADMADLVSACRGWWGAETGWAQVAERALFATLGWSIDADDRHVEVARRGDDAASCTITLPATAQQWRVELVAGRTVPTIACRAPGGLPAKTAREYEVVSVSSIA